MAFQSYLESIQVYLVLTFSGEALICKRREGKERKAPSLEFWVTGDCPTPFPCISIRGFPDWGEPQGTARHPPPYPSGLRPALRSPAPRQVPQAALSGGSWASLACDLATPPECSGLGSPCVRAPTSAGRESEHTLPTPC